MSFRSISNALVFTFSLTFISGCKEVKQPPETDKDINSVQTHYSLDTVIQEELVPLPPPPSVKDTVIMVYSDYDAVVIENTLLYQQPNFQSNAPFSLVTGNQVKIQEQGEKRVAYEGQDPCGQHGYYWYKVITTDSKEGYVYGKYLFWKSNNKFILTPEEDKEVGYYSLTAANLVAEDTLYYFDGAIDLSIGASTSEGQTGCDRWYVPMLINRETNKVSFIYIENSLLNNYDGHLKANREGILIMLYDSEGGKVEPYEIVNSEYDGVSVVTIRSSHHYQDGGSESLIYISRKDGWFDVKDIQRQSWDKEPE